MVEHAFSTGQKTASARAMWRIGKISDALAGDPYLTPVCRALLHTSRAPSYACFLIRRLFLEKPEKSSPNTHATWYFRRKMTERSFPMGRHESDGSKNDGVCFTV